MFPISRSDYIAHKWSMLRRGMDGLSKGYGASGG